MASKNQQQEKAAPKNSEPKKILIIRSGALGDVIMTTPLISVIKANFPSAKITYFVGEWSRYALANNPAIDEVISFDDKLLAERKPFKLLKIATSLKKKKFDICFVLDKHWFWSVFAFFTGAKKRYGFARKKDTLFTSVFNSKSIAFDGTKSELNYNLSLLSLAGLPVPKKPVKPAVFASYADKKIESIVEKSILRHYPKKILVGIAPGGAMNPGQKAFIKRWPLERFVELCDLAALDRNLKNKILFLIFGSKDERKYLEQVKNLSKNQNLILPNLDNLQQTKLLMDKCKIIITHDSGALHIASASLAKTIALFGPTPSERFAPEDAVVIKSKKGPYYNLYGGFTNPDEHCMAEISAKEVLSQLKKLLD